MQRLIASTAMLIALASGGNAIAAEAEINKSTGYDRQRLQSVSDEINRDLNVGTQPVDSSIIDRLPPVDIKLKREFAQVRVKLERLEMRDR